MADAGGGRKTATATFPRTSIDVSPMSLMKIVGAETSTAVFVVGVTSVQRLSGRPLMLTELETDDIRVRRMFHHWNQLPKSPSSSRPILRISSAIQTEARISSMVP